MALRRPPTKKLINSVSADTIKVVDGVIYIQGFGSFEPSDVAKCFKECPGTEQLKQVCLTVNVEESCECPPSYEISVVKHPDLIHFEVQSSFANKILVEYEKPNGATFTAAEAAAGIVEFVNANPAQPATAVQVTSCTTRTADTAGVSVLFTAKDGIINFDVHNPFGDIPTIITPYKRPILTSDELSRLFPIQPGSFGSRPELPHCGDYCLYYLLIWKCCADSVLSDQYAIDKDREYLAHEVEAYFYVNKNATGFEEHWDDALMALLPCLEDSSSS